MSELVSVVMATYNGERYITTQIESILNQSYLNLELIVVDDASTDKTKSILQELAIRDKRIKIVLSSKNIGFVANFERGLKLAEGEFIALSDQDDVFRNDKIQVMVNALKNNEVDLVISDVKLIDEKDVVISESMWKPQYRNPNDRHPFRRIIHSNYATGCSMMIKRKLLKYALPFPNNCMVHDWWLAVVASSSNSGGIMQIYDTLTSYRQHDMNTIGANKRSDISIAKNCKILFNKNKESERCRIRNTGINNHIMRVEGYLLLEIWEDKERLILKKYLKLLRSYQEDFSTNLLTRISNIPGRLYYSYLTRNSREGLEVLYFSLFPKK